MYISPSNVSDITLSLFLITHQEIKKEYTAAALDLMDKLTQAWYQCAHTDHRSKTKEKTLIDTVRKVISILKPTVKQRIEKQVNCMS